MSELAKKLDSCFIISMSGLLLSLVSPQLLGIPLYPNNGLPSLSAFVLSDTFVLGFGVCSFSAICAILAFCAGPEITAAIVQAIVIPVVYTCAVEIFGYRSVHGQITSSVFYVLVAARIEAFGGRGIIGIPSVLIYFFEHIGIDYCYLPLRETDHPTRLPFYVYDIGGYFGFLFIYSALLTLFGSTVFDPSTGRAIIVCMMIYFCWYRIGLRLGDSFQRVHDLTSNEIRAVGPHFRPIIHVSGVA